MKKISLKKLDLKEVEKLSREQLKNILGGWTDGSGTETGGETEPCPPEMPKCTINGVYYGCLRPSACCRQAGIIC